MPTVLNELEQHCKEEWAKIPQIPPFFPVLTFGERDRKSYRNDYFKLLLLKVGVEASASWRVLTIL